jgi:thiol:disulfide interchange protein DsbC
MLREITMKRYSRILMILLGMSMVQISAPSFAQKSELNASASAAEETIRASFRLSRPELGIETVAASEIPGLYAVQISNGPVLYSTADGKYFVLGDLYQVGNRGFVNLAEKAREVDRAELMATVDARDMIIFSPKKPAKASIMVFTDVDCFYCQKLHKEVPDLNRVGIEVRYLAYPRAGIGSDSYKKIASAWCANDRLEAMNKLKKRERIATNVCADNPVAEHFKLGGQVGVTGTPALITTDGRLMPGYMPALQLANALGLDVDPAIAAELERKQALAK